MSEEHMNDDDLAAIDSYLDGPGALDNDLPLYDHASALLAEVRRLRAAQRDTQAAIAVLVRMHGREVEPGVHELLLPARELVALPPTTRIVTCPTEPFGPERGIRIRIEAP